MVCHTSVHVSCHMCTVAEVAKMGRLHVKVADTTDTRTAHVCDVAVATDMAPMWLHTGVTWHW